MEPKLYLIAVYHDTLTLEHVRKTDRAVLQLLEQEQFGVVKKLGKESGQRVDKIAWLDKKGLVKDWQSFPVLAESSAYLLLKKIKSVSCSGDHELFLFGVELHKSYSTSCLTTGILREKKIIR